MAAPTLSDYIVKQGKQVKNLQKLLSYYGELFQFYAESGLPENKYIYYLEENTFKEPFTTLPPETLKFFSLRTDELTLLTPYVRIYKKFTAGNGKTKILEFPFENKTDFSSFEDPQRYLNNDMPFVAQRFNGPAAAITSLDLSYDGIRGKGATPADANAVSVNLSIFLQDAKMLFKNWGSVDNQLQYKDLFAQTSGNNQYRILIELGYNVPDGYDDLQKIANRKLLLNVSPLPPGTQFNYDEMGQLKLSVTLRGWSNRLEEEINLLDTKYYKQVKKKQNMLFIEDEERVSFDKYKEELDSIIDDKQAAVKKLKNLEQKDDKSKVNEKKSLIKKVQKTEKELEKKRRLVQLSKNIGSSPESFPYISALYEAGLIYYFEIDNDTYKNYIQKIAAGEPVDVSTLELLPKRKQKLKLSPDELLTKKNNSGDYYANTLRIKRLNTDEEESSSFEKIKFFYFGDLVAAILNGDKDTGVGQDLDKLGGEGLKFLFGPMTWVKNESTQVTYNVLNAPISLDMFLFEINREIYQKNKKRMTLADFFSIFMKRFFDTTILSTEKQKTGSEKQYYSAKTYYSFDKNLFERGGKFKTNLYELLPIDTDTVNVRLITCFPKGYNNITKKIAKRRNIPNIYIGGPDRGPVKSLQLNIRSVPGLSELYSQKNIKSNSYSEESISEVVDSSILVTGRSAVSFKAKGNTFLNLGDHVFVDTRFVDGGFFQEKENTIFMTGFYYIYKISHSFDLQSLEWTTDYSGQFVSDGTSEDSSYKAFSGELPTSQNVNIADEANITRQSTINIANSNSSYESASSKESVTKKTGSSKTSTSSKNSTVEPVTVPKTK